MKRPKYDEDLINLYSNVKLKIFFQLNRDIEEHSLQDDLDLVNKESNMRYPYGLKSATLYADIIDLCYYYRQKVGISDSQTFTNILYNMSRQSYGEKYTDHYNALRHGSNILYILNRKDMYEIYLLVLELLTYFPCRKSKPTIHQEIMDLDKYIYNDQLSKKEN